MPNTSKVVSGVKSPIPTLPFSNTANLELEPEAMLNKVAVSPTRWVKAIGEVVPIPTLPPIIFKVLAVAVALTVRALLAPARNPLATDSEPAKLDEPVPEKVLVPYVKKLPDIEATPPKEAVPLVSRSPEISKSLFAEI